jgi:hypothetical protein
MARGTEKMAKPEISEKEISFLRQNVPHFIYTCWLLADSFWKGNLDGTDVFFMELSPFFTVNGSIEKTKFELFKTIFCDQSDPPSYLQFCERMYSVKGNTEETKSIHDVAQILYGAFSEDEREFYLRFVKDVMNSNGGGITTAELGLFQELQNDLSTTRFDDLRKKIEQ